MKQTAVEWLIDKLKNDDSMNVCHSGLDYWAEEAKKKEDEGLQRLNDYWVERKEQTRHFAERIGFRKGVELGLLNAEDYWNEYEAFQNGDAFKDDTEFNNNYIDELWNSTQNK